jgi:Response regulator containing a CheY-like receiver domain and an HTH DNA-binding domain
MAKHPSPREREVLHLLIDGLTAKEIAKKLYVSAHTVETHKRNMIAKLQVQNTMQLVVKAIKMGVV